MTIDGARNVPAGAVLHTDVCVIGSGAAGITIAHALDGTTLDVLLVEAGGLKRDLATEREVFQIEQLGMPALNPEAPRARFYGGSTNLWFGRIAALDPIDFEPRTWVPNSGWPISHAELAPWIERAAELLDVPRFDTIDPGVWGPNATIETFDGARGAELGVFLWADAKLMGERYRAEIERSPNVKLLLDSTVTALIPNEAGNAIDEIEVAGPGAERFVIRATSVVLAAGGLENPRLLLASTARRAAGIGNEHDLVGRFYMDHPRGEGLAEADLTGLPAIALERLTFLGERTSSEHGSVQLRVKWSAQHQRDEQLLNHAMHAHLVSAEQASAGFQSAKRLVQRLRSAGTAEREPIAADVRNVVRDAPALVKLGVKKLTHRVRPTGIVFIDQMEQEPDPASRVTVDPTRRDRYGLPRLQVDWRIGESTYRSQRRMHELMGTVLGDVGIDTFTSRLLDDPGLRPELWDMKHPSGTTRMASAPDRGVVDTDGRIHGVANLYVAGSSVFPTIGHANPTLTIVALAARLAARLAGDAPERRPARAVTDATRTARLGVGCARMGEATGGVSWRRSVRILRDAADSGVTYFDTADAYTSGTSERLIGEAFRGRRRDDVVIATKAGYLFRGRSLAEARARFIAGPVLQRLGRGVVESATSDDGKFAAQDFTPGALRAALDASLRRLRTDHVDVFQLHAPRGVDVDAVMELIADLTAAGKIRRFGIGVEQLSEVDPWLDVPGLHSIELPFSVADRSAASIIATARDRRVSIVARSVLGGGWIARSGAPEPAGEATASLLDDLRAHAKHRGMTLMQLAVAFAAGYPGVDVVLVGVRTPEHLAGLLGASASRAPARELLDEIDGIIADHQASSEPQES